MREFYEVITDYPFATFFLCLFIIVVLDGIKDIVRR